MSERDAVLVWRARNGDPAAFEELVRRTSRLVFARLYLDTGCSHLAEDLLQETLLKAYRSLHQLTDPNGFRPWLLTIAQNVHMDSVKAAGRKKRSTPGRTAVPLAVVPSTELGPEDEAQRTELRHAVLEAVRGLPEEYRLPITLRYITGSDYEAIGTQLGLSNGSLRGLLHRGLKLLRERLPADV